MKVAVLKGGRSLEREVSLKSGARVEDALGLLGHEGIPLDVGADLVEAGGTEGPPKVASAKTLSATYETPYLKHATMGPTVAVADVRSDGTVYVHASCQHPSMLRNEIYCFSRAGTFIERADNTARILDVKYYLLLPSLAYVGTALDTAQWDNVLRSLSGERAYRWLNAGRMDARSIADFVILDDRFPRSLAFTYVGLRENLADLARLHGVEGKAHVMMREAGQQLTGKTIDEIFDRGLHEFLVEFIRTNQAVASAISEQYRFIG